MTDPYMLVSLKDKEAKSLSKVIGSGTCRKILEYLAEKDATESEISKDLGMAMSTVHYNLSQLKKAKLIVAEEFHYSPKGREVLHYKLANKYIVIAPQEDKKSFLQHLKKYVPVAIITVALAAVLKTMQLFTGSSAAMSKTEALFDDSYRTSAPVAEKIPLAVEEAADAMAKGLDTAAMEVADSAGAMAAEAVDVVSTETVNQTIQEVAKETTAEATRTQVNCIVEGGCVINPQPPWWQSSLVDWFLIGAIAVFVIFIVVEFVRWKRNS